MATIDPNIALGVKPLQVENPMAQYAMLSQLQTGQNQNALAQYQLSAAQRTDQKANFLNESIAKNTDLTTGKINQLGVYSDLAKGGFGSAIPELQTKFSDIEHKENVNKKNVVDTTAAAIKNIREKASDLQFNPSDDNVRAHAQDAVLHGVWTQAQADQNIATAIALPMNQRPAYFAKQGLDAEKRVTTTETNRANLEREKTAKDTLIENTRSHKVHEGISYQTMANASNPELQSKLAGSKKTAELNATDQFSKVKDVEGAQKVLKNIGFDPKTGANKVTDLIRQSTGSYGGASIDFLGRVIGESTEGADAIGQLKTFETKIATDLLGGKLGAGISNTDRDFIMAGLGQISDNTIPRDTREKAWNRVVERMKDVGLLDSLASKPNTNVSSGVDTNNVLLNPPKKK